MTRRKYKRTPQNPMTREEMQAKMCAYEDVRVKAILEIEALAAPIRELRLRLCAATTHRGETTVEDFRAGWDLVAEIRQDYDPLSAQYKLAKHRKASADRRIHDLRWS